MLTLLSASLLMSAQAPTAKSDADHITDLLTALSSHSKTPVDVLDPTLSPANRDKSLGHFSLAPYELNLKPEGDPVILGDTASVPIRVHYKAEDGNSLESSATAQFVRRNGTWYFSSFDFMGWPVILTVVLVICICVGIGYAAAVLLLRNRLAKRGPIGINVVKMFIPFFWPSLFRQTS
jgi:hypothetical protein